MPYSGIDLHSNNAVVTVIDDHDPPAEVSLIHLG
ncbi:hypothetical protein OKW45_000920 [Paraburkholderia sp. WSM4175]